MSPLARDTGTGLDHFPARNYFSTWGRWLTPDDGSAQSPNDGQSWDLYSYARDNPTSFTDPDGHEYCKSGTVAKHMSLSGTGCISDATYATLSARARAGWTQVAVDQTVDVSSTNPPDVPLFDPFAGLDAVVAQVSAYRPGAFVRDFAALSVLAGVPGGIEAALGAEAAITEGGVVIGKMDDLRAPGALRPGERSLVVPNQGDPQANWVLNSTRLREAIAEGSPIRDASARPEPKRGEPAKNTGFLKAERNLLKEHGWRYRGGWWFPSQ